MTVSKVKASSFNALRQTTGSKLPTASLSQNKSLSRSLKGPLPISVSGTGWSVPTCPGITARPRSHREDQRRFFASHRFFSLKDLAAQLAVHNARSSNRPMRPLRWQSLREFLALHLVQYVWHPYRSGNTEGVIRCSGAFITLFLVT